MHGYILDLASASLVTFSRVPYVAWLHMIGLVKTSAVELVEMSLYCEVASS